MIRTDSKYDARFSGKLAVFCSDERFLGAVFEYLEKRLGIKRCDMMVVPGGPAFIVNGEKNLLDRMKLLVKNHSISEILLFSHFSCAYYENRYGNSESKKLFKRQLNDIKKCRRLLNKCFPGSAVRAFYIDINGDSIVFKAVK